MVNPVKNKFRGEGITMAGAATYQIVVQGAINSSWSSRLEGMNITERRLDNGEVETVLVGRLADQAALSSVLHILYELHLPVVSADCLNSG